MSSDFDPLPDERGDLQPPRRRPPTAIGTMTPPPPGRSPSARHHVHWSRLGIAVLVFASPLLLGALGWSLIRGADSPWVTAAGWLVASLGAVVAAMLTWFAGVLPVRDHLRTRAADRLSHAR